jgi:hypothetical protein
VPPGVVDRGRGGRRQLAGHRAGQQHRVCGRSEVQVGPARQQRAQVGRPDRRPDLQRGGRTGHQPAQRGLLLRGQAGQLRVGGPAREQRERLQHAVVHRAGQPLALGGRGLQLHRLGVRRLGATGQRDDVADHGAEQQQEHHAVDRGLRGVATGDDRGGADPVAASAPPGQPRATPQAATGAAAQLTGTVGSPSAIRSGVWTSTDDSTADITSPRSRTSSGQPRRRGSA